MIHTFKKKVTQSVRLFVTPWTIQSIEFSRSEYWSGQPFPSPGDLPNPGIEPRFPALPVDSLPAEPPGKPKNTGMGSLSLLQQIFLTQDSNRGLRHCRQILYQLSYQGSPTICHVIDLDLFIITVRYFANFNCIRCLGESEATQLCLTLCNPMNCSLPGSSVHGIFQARVLLSHK